MKASQVAEQLQSLVTHTGVDPEMVEHTNARGTVSLVIWIHFGGAYVRGDEYLRHPVKYAHLGNPTRITVSAP